MIDKRRVAADTNVLIYAEIEQGDPRRTTSVALLDRLSAERRLVLPIQVMGELFRVLTGKFRVPKSEVRGRIALWRLNAELVPTDLLVLDGALRLAEGHGLAIWDAIILSASAENGCLMLLSEDLHDGFVWRGCTVANPFAATRHPLLVSLLS